MSSYSLDITLCCPFQVAIERVKVALKDQGFGTLCETDVQATLREKIGKEIPAYTILGVCNPNLAAQAIEIEPNIGVFLPCTVLLRQVGNRVQVSAQDPALMEEFLGNPDLEPLGREARTRILDALRALD